MSQALLSTLDAILGSTESSRAIAAIITLIRREFRGTVPSPGAEKIGVGDLLVGSVGFALLQSWGRKNTERYMHENGGDEMIWDVVILDNGTRADVVRTNQIEFPNPPSYDLESDPQRSSFISTEKDEGFDAVQRRASIIDALDSPHLSLSPENQNQVTDEDIRLYIMKQLPRGCHVSIRTDLVTARTITVDVFDDNSAEISPPPGTKMIEESFREDQDGVDNTVFESHPLPRHTVVFRTAFNQSQSANVRPQDRHDYFTVPTSRDDVGTGLSFDEIGYLNYAQEEPLDDSQPSQTTHATAKLTSPKHHYRSLSYPSHSGPEAPKGPFTKLAQKMRPAATENAENTKRSSLKPPFERSVTPFYMTTSAQSRKSPRSDSNTRKASPSGSRSPLPAANRSAPRSSLHDSSGHRSTRSPARRVNPRDGRDARNDRYAVRGKGQESYLMQTDTFSARPVHRRPRSPAPLRNHVRSNSSMSLTRSEADMTISLDDSRPGPSSMHPQSKSFTPSLYSLATAGSETSLILAHRTRKSPFEDMDTVQTLNRDGSVPGIFPENHFVLNIRRFSRFSSASYGSSALKVMGVRKDTKALPPQGPHSQEHSEFSDHAGLPPSTILLSSFVDPEGGSNAAGETDTGFPLVHFLCLDHESKAVVLTLRGTWGFEDILTDMTCDYDDLMWQGKSWKVHKGMHASAKRLLEGGGGRVMITIRAALEEFPGYGVVLCGHSLGGGVAALLATMISEPVQETAGTSFVTASYQSITQRMFPSGNGIPNKPQPVYFLPPGRPIHVYAYGPPAVMSPFLRRATRGLITTIVNGGDVVPSLSLGILHDMHAVSLAFKSDTSGTKSNVRYRVWESLRQSIVNKFYVKEAPMLVHAGDGVGEDAWAWETLKGLREEMCAPKLMPPGEVFVVETMRVLQRDAFTHSSTLGDDVPEYPRLGRPATRVQLKFIRDVEALFGELRFGSGMLSDHNPARYETSLAALARGILDE